MLCSPCSQKVYIANIGSCVQDGHYTSSGAFKLCKGCSQKLNECMHCRTKLTGSKKS